MMEALKDLDKKSVGGVLSAAMLKSWCVNSLPEDPRINSLANRVISEVRESLGFEDSDMSAGALEAIRTTLDKEANMLLFRGDDRDNALSRLGARGDLPERAFELEASSGFLKSQEKFSNAKKAIRRASLVEHLAVNGDADRKRWSLFLQEFPSRDGSEPRRYNLVLAKRTGSKLRVDHMWRVYPDLVELTGITPLAVLKDFVAHYGLPLLVNGEPFDEKLMLETRFKRKAGVPIIMAQQTAALEREIGIYLHADWNEVSAWITYAFAIDEGRYEKDLRGRR